MQNMFGLALIFIGVVGAQGGCSSSTFVDPTAPGDERRTIIGECGYFVGSPSIPAEWEQVGYTSWQWCKGWGQHQKTRKVAACSIEQETVDKNLLTTCDTQECWLGFLANDIPDPVKDRIGGLWYMDGNPFPEEVVTFHGATWTNDNREAQIDIYKERNWAMHASIPGTLQNALVHQFGASLKFTVEPAALGKSNPADGTLLATARIVTVIDWAQSVVDVVFRDWIGLVMELRATSNPNVMDRTGTSPYKLRRFIGPTGQKTDQFDIWKADVEGKKRPDTNNLRGKGKMPNLLLNHKKKSIPECSGCKQP